MSESWTESTSLKPREVLDRAAELLGVGASEGDLVRGDDGGSFRLVVHRGFYSSWAPALVGSVRAGSAGSEVVFRFEGGGPLPSEVFGWFFLSLWWFGILVGLASSPPGQRNGILLGAAGGAVVTSFTLGLGWMGRRWARKDRLRLRGMAADLTRP